MEIRYLYRGTTEGWGGHPVLPVPPMTCTTTDPLVATLFAIECRNHGHAVILAAQRDLFEDLIGPANHFDLIESAVNLVISPLDFAQQAVTLEIDRVVDILRDIGFDQMPIRLRDKWALREALVSSYDAGERLNAEQLRQFNTSVFGTQS
jgi:hypothetical protein